MQSGALIDGCYCFCVVVVIVELPRALSGRQKNVDTRQITIAIDCVFDVDQAKWTME